MIRSQHKRQSQSIHQNDRPDQLSEEEQPNVQFGSKYHKYEDYDFESENGGFGGVGTDQGLANKQAHFPALAGYESDVIKTHLKENSKIKIKVCVIGGHHSGKTSLINAYLKYQKDSLQKFVAISENSLSDIVILEQNSIVNENIPTISLKSMTSSNSIVSKQIREKLREISRFKTNQMSERIVNS